MKDLAIAKLNKELKEVKGGRHVDVIKQPVRDALVEFCNQDAEFAQAVYQGGSFSDCLNAVIKGVGSAISDLEAYRRAVRFYFPGADISFQMSVRLGPDEGTPRPEKIEEKITFELFDLI